MGKPYGLDRSDADYLEVALFSVGEATVGTYRPKTNDLTFWPLQHVVTKEAVQGGDPA